MDKVKNIKLLLKEIEQQLHEVDLYNSNAFDEQCKLIINSNLNAYFITVSNHFVFANKAFLELINKKRFEDIAHKNLDAFLTFETGSLNDYGIVDGVFLARTKAESTGHKTLEIKSRKITHKENVVVVYAVTNISDENTLKLERIEALERLKQAEFISKTGNYRIDLNTGQAVWSDGIFYIFEWNENRSVPTVEEYQNHVHPDDITELNKKFEQCIVNKANFDMVYRIYTSKHKIKYVHSMGKYFEKENQKYLIGHLQDVTQKIEFENRLLLYKDIVSSAPNTISFVDRDYIYRIINKTYLSRYNKSEHEIVGKSIEKMVGKKQFEEIIKPRFDECLLGKTVNFYDWMGFPGSDKKYFDATYYPVFSSTGVVEGVVVSAKDITETHKLNQKVKDNEAFYTKLLSNIDDSVFLVSKNGDFNFVCDNVSAVFEYSKEEVLKMLHIKSLIPGIDMGIETLKNSKVVNYETVIQTKSGLNKTILTSSKYFDEEQNEVLITIKDISQLKLSNENLKKALNDSENKEKELQALLNAATQIPLSNEFEPLAKNIFTECKNSIGARSGYIALFNTDKNENEVVYLDAGGLPCTVDPNLPMPIRGLRESAYKYGKAVYENHFNKSEWQGFMPAGHVGLKNVLFAPMTFGNQTLGLIGLANKPGNFTELDAEKATSFGKMAGLALAYLQNKKELSDSEEKYRSIVELSPIGVGIFKGNELIFANHALLNIFLFKSADEFKNNLVEHIYEPDQAMIRERLKRISEKKAEYPFIAELRIVDSAKNIKHIRVFISELLIKGEFLSQTLTQDITPEKTIQRDKQQLVADLLYVEQKNKLLLEIQKSLSLLARNESINQEATFKELKELVSQNIDHKTESEKLKINLQQLNQDFYGKLKAKHPGLSQTDLKICSLIKLNLNTKEIASLLNVKPTSIQTSRVRIKRKMNLSSAHNLIDYILSL